MNKLITDLKSFRDDFLLELMEDVIKPKFKCVPTEINDFRNKHFFGNRIKRVPLAKVLAKK